MITKKWVEEKLVGVRKTNKETKEILDQTIRQHEQAIAEIKNHLGYTEYFSMFGPDVFLKPTISIPQKIDALCKYLNIEIIKQEQVESIIVQEIKKTPEKK